MADPQKDKEKRPRRNPSQAEIEEVETEMKEAIRSSHEILMTANTVFPFTLFPDTITLDRTKLTITRRNFFRVAEVMSIRVEDILNVTANVNPLFGSLHIVSRVLNPDKPFDLTYLWREDSMKFKRVLQGMIIALQKEIDLTPLKTKELVEMLERLGKDDHPES
jgi:hypothetical protein